jgi:hypothetical protein
VSSSHCFHRTGWQKDTKHRETPQFRAAEALTRQEQFINQNLALQALGMLTQLMRHGSVSYLGGFCNLAIGQLVPIEPSRPSNPSGLSERLWPGE